MSAALLDADKEIESLCSDPQQQSWIRSQENSVESLNALNKRQALGGAIGGLLGFSQSQYGAPSQGQLSPGWCLCWCLCMLFNPLCHPFTHLSESPRYL